MNAATDIAVVLLAATAFMMALAVLLDVWRNGRH